MTMNSLKVVFETMNELKNKIGFEPPQVSFWL